MRKTLSKCVLLLLCTVLTRASWAEDRSLEEELKNPGEGNVAITVFNVGQGSCALISCPDGEKVLMDCGSSGSVEREDVTNAESLFRSIVGTEGLEAMILSHGDRDHYNFVQQFLSAPGSTESTSTVPVNKVLIGGLPNEYIVGNLDNWLGELGDRLVMPKVSGTGPSSSGISCGTTEGDGLYLLAANTTSATGNKNKNQDSVVTMLSISGGKDKSFRMIFPGDAGGPVENTILSKAGEDKNLKVDVALAGHHGAETDKANSAGWVNTIAPSAVIYSAGKHSGFRHPRCTIVDRYKKWTAQRGIEEHDLNCGNKKSPPWENRKVKDAQFNTTNSGAVILVYNGASGKTRIYGCPKNALKNCTSLGSLGTSGERVVEMSPSGEKRPSTHRDDEEKTKEVGPTRKKTRVARSISDSH